MKVSQIKLKSHSSYMNIQRTLISIFLPNTFRGMSNQLTLRLPLRKSIRE
jgi:hypothetical protein